MKIEKISDKPFWTLQEELDSAMICKNLGIATENITLFQGKGWSGKTLFCQALALALTGSGSFLDFEVQPHQKVLYVNLEMSKVLFDVTIKKIKTTDFNYDRLDCTQEFSLDDDLSELYDYDVLFIDSLSSLNTDADENDNSEMSIFMNKLLVIARKYHLAVVLIHHEGKTKKSDGRDSGRGATVIYNLASSVYNMSISGDENTGKIITASHTKNRFGKSHDFRVKLSSDELGRTKMDPISISADERNNLTNEYIVEILTQDPKLPVDKIRTTLRDKYQQRFDNKDISSVRVNALRKEIENKKKAE